MDAGVARMAAKHFGEGDAADVTRTPSCSASESSARLSRVAVSAGAQRSRIEDYPVRDGGSVQSMGSTPPSHSRRTCSIAS